MIRSGVRMKFRLYVIVFVCLGLFQSLSAMSEADVVSSPSINLAKNLSSQPKVRTITGIVHVGDGTVSVTVNPNLTLYKTFVLEKADTSFFKDLEGERVTVDISVITVIEEKIFLAELVLFH